MSARCFVVTGVPPGAQDQARARGRARRRLLALEGKVDRTMRHRVRGQVVEVYAGEPGLARALAEAAVARMLAGGLAVTLRRWRPR